jgi:hypothetical protein
LMAALGFFAPCIQAADVYTFESLAVNSAINGQDHWKDQPGQGDAIVSLDATGNGTKIVRHFKTVIFDQSAFITRTNDAGFNFVSFSGSETNAVIQFEVNGEHAAMFALGHDRNSDGLLLSTDGELGPSFGVYGRNFRIQQAGLGTATETAFGSGNSGNDWYRLQLRLDFTADGGEGTGSLYYMNLTDGDTVFQAVAGLTDLPLGLGGLHPDARPARWSAMWLHLLSKGDSVPCVDNLVPNLYGMEITDIIMAGSDMTLKWRGGMGPYQVQRRISLDDGKWENASDVTILPESTVAIDGVSGFFRITRP